MRVLVVDDEPAVRAAVQRALALEGYEVDTRRGRPRGARPARATEPDAIVLDIACRTWTASRSAGACAQAGDRTPVLMLTARDAVGDRVAGLDAGADDYLVKPFALRGAAGPAAGAAAPRRPAPTASALRFADLRARPGTREVAARRARASS